MRRFLQMAAGALLGITLSGGCYASHETPGDSGRDAGPPPCCNSGTYEIVDGAYRGTKLELDLCRASERRCFVDGSETTCFVGRGTLFVVLDDDGFGDSVGLDHLSCIGAETTGHTDDEEVTVRRVGP